MPKNRDAGGYGSACLFCEVAYLAEELEAAVNQRDGGKALDLMYELTWRVEEVSNDVAQKFRVKEVCVDD